MKMKQNSIQKVLILLVVGIGICFPCFSQQCVSDTLVTYPAGDITYVGYGFIDVNNLPCISSGSYSELVIPFKTYNQGARLLTLQDSSTVPISKIYRIKREFRKFTDRTLLGNKTILSCYIRGRGWGRYYQGHYICFSWIISSIC
jgi:hypothetical protein